MKRQLRVSGLKDYIAVDMVNDKGVILSTPFYLNITNTIKIRYKDEGESYITNVTMAAGDKNYLLCHDSTGFEFTIPFDELLESHIQFI